MPLKQLASDDLGGVLSVYVAFMSSIVLFLVVCLVINNIITKILINERKQYLSKIQVH